MSSMRNVLAAVVAMSLTIATGPMVGLLLARDTAIGICRDVRRSFRPAAQHRCQKRTDPTTRIGRPWKQAPIDCAEIA